MKRVCMFAGVIALVVFATPGAAQTRPNFAGRWVQVTPAEGAGQEQVIKHEGDRMTVTHGSSGDDHVLEYSLDGRETTQTLTSHGEPLSTKVRAVWEKESLVITTVTQHSPTQTVSLKQTWTLDKSGHLTIVVNRTVSGEIQAPITVVYTKKALPTFAGTWAPAEPARSDSLFNVGLAVLPGDGRLTIEQRPNRLTVTMTMPDAKLEPILDITGRFYPTIMYRVTAERARPVGYGAGGPQAPTGPTWFGDSLVIPDARPSARPITTTYSLDGDRLKVETLVQISNGRSNTVTEWFTRVQ